MKSCDVYPSHPVSSTRRCYDYPWATLKPHSSVYIIGSSVPDFLQRGWPLITVPFVLVTGDCDQTVPLDIVTEAQFKDMVENPKLLAWFSQNLVLDHPKLHPIPIGLDYHTLASSSPHPWGPQQTPANQEALLKAIQNRMPDRLVKSYGNFQFSMATRYAEDRRDALKGIDASAIDYEAKAVNRFTTWANQSKYHFVASPFGGGLDCHRTWEALALNTFPILHSSPLDAMFEGMPVLLVKAWTEVTPVRLQQFLEEHQSSALKQSQHPKMTLAYWVQQIHKKQQA